MEHLVCEQGDESEAVHRKQREDRHVDQQQADDRLAHYVRGSLRKSLPPPLVVLLANDGGQVAHQQQRGHSCQVAHGVR